MRCYVVSLLLLLFASAVKAATPDVKFSGEWLGFYTAQGVRDSTPYNPGNALAGLPRGRWETILRGDLSAHAGPLTAAIGPRFMLRKDVGTNAVSTETSDHEAYLQTWQLEWRSDAVDVFYNRELLLWGPSLFASPSNPFFRDTNQVNPFLELPSRDFVGARWRLGDSAQLNLLVNVGRGRDTETLRDFHSTTALQFSYYGYDYSLGAIAANRQSDWHLGAYGQYTLSDSVLVYGDAAWIEASERLAARADRDGWMLRPSTRRRKFDVLVGGAYTFENGVTVNAELRHNGRGYSRHERAQMDRYAAFHRDRFEGYDPALAGHSAQALGAAFDTHASTYGRNYLYLQYNDQQLFRNTSLVMQWSYGIDTRESSLSAVLTYDATDRIRLLANANVFMGDGSNEYHKYLDYIVFAGMKVFF